MSMKFALRNSRYHLPCLPSLNENQGEIVPAAIGLFAGVDLKAVMPGGLKHMDAAGFYHGSHPELGSLPARPLLIPRCRQKTMNIYVILNGAQLRYESRRL